jgi:hypothetical protein
MNITIKLIPPEEHRACVDGCDWYWDEQGDLQVRISPLGDWREETLLAIHETMEAIMCKHNGVTQQQVDEFDIEFDRTHPDLPDAGAGDDPAAPYAREHRIATGLEMVLCAELGVNWMAYMTRLEEIYPGVSKRVPA